MKKKISVFTRLVACLLFVMNFGTISFAAESDEYFLGSRLFRPDGTEITNNGGIQLFAAAYTPGTIKIDDKLHDTSAIYSADSKKVKGTAAKNTAVIIISNIPGIGNVVSTVSSIVDLLSSYNSAFNSVDYSKETKVETQYSYRNFTHYIKAYTKNYIWKDVGSSLSRYYYKHIRVTAYSKNKGDYVTTSKDFTHSNGFAPEKIAKARNYKNYSMLSSLGYEAYVYNRTYKETY